MKKLIKKTACAITVFILVITQFSFVNNNIPEKKPYSGLAVKSNTYSSLYDGLQLNTLNLSREAFDLALDGYNYLLSASKIKNEGILSIIDFSLPSKEKRLFVIDLEKGTLLFNTYVSHGRNSGKEQASQFSNEPESFKSSLGFYTTSNTCTGKHGYSLKLKGEEQGINDNALARGIVMHSAPYVNEDIIKMQGYIGRSQGCPALSEQVYKPLIEKIKNGTCLFIYSPDKFYMQHSQILKNITPVS